MSDNRVQNVWTANEVRDQIIGCQWFTDTPIDSLYVPGCWYVWGQGGSGNLAQGTTASVSSPILLPGEWNKVTMSEGEVTQRSIYAIKCDGSLWVAGNNAQGQLGLNDTINRCTLVQMYGENTWCDVRASRYFALGIKENSTLWVWGQSPYVYNGSTCTSSPVQIPGTTWCSVFSLCNATVFMANKCDGTTWYVGKVHSDYNYPNWGYNSVSSPVSLGGKWICASSDGSSAIGVYDSYQNQRCVVFFWGYNQFCMYGCEPYSGPVCLAVNGRSPCKDPSGYSMNWIQNNTTLYGVGFNVSGRVAQNFDYNIYCYPNAVRSNVQEYSFQSQASFYLSSSVPGCLRAWGRDTNDLGINCSTIGETATDRLIPGLWSLTNGTVARRCA